MNAEGKGCGAMLIFFIRQFPRCQRGFLLVVSKLKPTRINTENLEGPNQPHLCSCLHARVWLFCFNRSMSKRRKSLRNYFQEHNLHFASPYNINNYDGIENGGGGLRSFKSVRARGRKNTERARKANLLSCDKRKKKGVIAARSPWLLL